MAVQYNETDFVLYAFEQMGIAVIEKNGKFIKLPQSFVVEVERRDLYRLSVDGFVISPFDDIGNLCSFIKKNLSTQDEEN